MSIRRLLLVLLSMMAAAATAEVLLRWSDQAGVSSSSGGTARLAADYAARAELAQGIHGKWFAIDPPPLPRAPLPADMAAVADALSRSPLPDPAVTPAGSDVLTRVPPSEMFKAWNRRFVEDRVCDGDTFFRRFPGFVLAFESPSGTAYPRYRYLPGMTTPAGLVTNDHGWRGPAIAADKPAQTIRLAFVGASTTVGSHNQPFSYPEFLATWLNLWAQAEWPGVRVDVINAGREGVSSTDIAAIVRDELAGVEPDVVIYYEGANQFTLRDLITVEDDDGRRAGVLDQNRPALPGAGRAAVMGRLEILRRRAGLGASAEPPKPRYRLQWPPGVDEAAPDLNASNLPLDLPRIIRDLDQIKASMAAVRGQLMLTSFVWMVEAGMVLDPVDHAYFWQSLNRAHWPATYADIRRLADFQNRVLASYARSRGLAFVDMAAAYPRDPRLFGDAVHRTPDGDRLHAWLLLQQIVPWLRRELQAGRLPSPDHLPTASVLRWSDVQRVPVSCAELAQFAVAGADQSLDVMVASVPEARVTGRSPTIVETPPLRSAYAAELPISPAPDVAAFRIRLRVVSGRVAVGILTPDRREWVTTRSIEQTSEPVEAVLSLGTATRAGFVMIANAVATDGVRSVVEVERLQPLRRVGGDR